VPGRVRALGWAAWLALLAVLVPVGAAALAGGLAIDAGSLTVRDVSGGVSPTTCALATSARDAAVDSALVNQPFGTDPELQVQSGALETRRVLVGFDLAACAIPTTARVTSATLELRMTSAPVATRTYVVHRVRAAWSEATVTWATQPAVAAASTATLASGTASGVQLAWDVTADAQASVADPASDHGWRVSDAAEGALVIVSARFASREHAEPAQRPRLVVTYFP